MYTHVRKKPRYVQTGDVCPGSEEREGGNVEREEERPELKRPDSAVTLVLPRSLLPLSVVLLPRGAPLNGPKIKPRKPVKHHISLT